MLATHKSSVSIFDLGSPASAGLVEVAENGYGNPLADSLSTLPQAFEAVVETQPIPPPTYPYHPVTFNISSRGHFGRFSMVSTLVNPKDAFLGIDTVMLPRRRGSSLTYHAVAYNAGSENNNQECAYVPGPACPEGSGNARDESGVEGFVYIHNRVHQIGDLSPTNNDWHNPVAKAVMTRLR